MIGMSMKPWISEIYDNRIKIALKVIILLPFVLLSCEKPVTDESSVSDGSPIGNVSLTFAPTGRDVTRAGAAAYFSRLNVQLFDGQGAKVFDKVKTQVSSDSDFASLSLQLSPGTYTVVAVGHSSKNAASINSPTDVRFTASNGEKLTDTFCACQQIVVSGSPAEYTLDMYRVSAMVQFCLEDDDVPDNFAYFTMEYSGGSANFSPTTFEGITKSSQSERRVRNSLNIHQAYTFPYMSATGSLKMTCTATASDGTVIRSRVFESVPVSRNRITTYSGPFFSDGDGQFTQSDFSFVIHADWDGEEKFTY